MPASSSFICRLVPSLRSVHTPINRRIDGADVAAKRRKTGSAGDSKAGQDGGAEGEGEDDISLERYEYAAPSAILSGVGGGVSGFVITRSFNREKSATKEALDLIRPHLPTRLACAPHGLRLNPVKMPGRGFIFVRLSERPPPASRKSAQPPAAATEKEAEEDEEIYLLPSTRV